MEEIDDPLVLDSLDIAYIAIIQTVRTLEKIRKDQYDKYMTKGVIDQTTSLFDLITRNKVSLFSRPTLRASLNSKQNVTSFKNECTLFSRVYR